MQTVKSLLFIALAGVAVTGCAADPADDLVDANGKGDNGGEDEELEVPTDASGSYALRSRFDLVSAIPGTAGTVINTLIEATDDPDDPTAWVLEQLIDAMPNGALKTLLNQAKPLVAGYLNDAVLEIAPDFVPVLVNLGDDLGQVATNFGLLGTLDVAATGGGYTGVHTVTGAHFKIDGIESDHPFNAFGVAESVAGNVAITLGSGGKLGIAQHSVALSYGAVLRIALDAAIIPQLAPGARSLNDLLRSKVDCELIGDIIDAVIGFGGGTFTNACFNGLDAAADLVYSKIAEIDGEAMQLGLAGNARALDKNADSTIDMIQTGTWTGTASYAGLPAPLATSTFYGTRQ